MEKDFRKEKGRRKRDLIVFRPLPFNPSIFRGIKSALWYSIIFFSSSL